MGLKTAAEIFADRAYMEDLSLVPWKQSGAMITDEDLAVERCIKMIKEHKVTAITGKEIEIQGDTPVSYTHLTPVSYTHLTLPTNSRV